MERERERERERIDHNNIVGEQYVYMIKFKIHSVVLHIYESQESKILDQKRTLNITKELTN